MDSSNSAGRARIPRPPRRSQLRAAAETASRSSGSRIDAVQRSARGSCGGAVFGADPGSGSRRRGTAPTVKRSRRRRHDADLLEPALQLTREVRELGGPDGAARVHHELAVGRQPGGPCLARDRLADGLRPAPRDRGHVGRPTGRFGQRAADHIAQRLEAVASCRLDQLAGPHADRARDRGRELVALGRREDRLARRAQAPRAGAPGVRGRAPRRRRRAAGAAARLAPRPSVSASASTSASSALRCSPCEPNERTSRASAKTMSSSCGPAPVSARSMSRRRRRRRASRSPSASTGPCGR